LDFFVYINFKSSLFYHNAAAFSLIRASLAYSLMKRISACGMAKFCPWY